jgi:hypothetical protein
MFDIVLLHFVDNLLPKQTKTNKQTNKKQQQKSNKKPTNKQKTTNKQTQTNKQKPLITIMSTVLPVDYFKKVFRFISLYFYLYQIFSMPCIVSPLARSTFVPNPHPGGNFADLLVTNLKVVHCLRNILSVVCTLAVGIFSRNMDLK